MRIVFFGTPDEAVPSLRALVAAGHEVAVVVTQPDRPAGRARVLTPSPVKVAAASLGLPLWQPERINAAGGTEHLAATGAELGAVVAFGQIFRAPLLAALPRGLINLHFSLLPAFRGAAPVPAAILAGCVETGVSVQQVAVALDAGPILRARATPMGADEDAGALRARLAVLGAETLVATVADLAAGRARPVSQDEAAASYAGRIAKEDGRLDWARDAAFLARFVRAMTPWPGAFTEYQDARGRPQRLAVIAARAEPEPPPATANAPCKSAPDAPAPPLGAAVPSTNIPPPPLGGRAGVGGEPAPPPGTVLPAPPGELLVATGAGRLRLRAVQRPGKAALAVAAFLRGCPLPPGLRFATPGAGES